MIISDKFTALLPPATPLLSTEMTIKDLWLDMLGLKKAVDLRSQYVKISTKTPVFSIDIPK